MEDKQLQKILNLIKYVPDDERDETTQAILKAAADSITLEKLSALTDGKINETTKTETTECSTESIKFSEKEIKQMPKQFRHIFRFQGCVARVYVRPSGKNAKNYEIRFKRCGYNVYASANNLEAAKQKFMARLAEIDKYGVNTAPAVPTTMDGFAKYFFEKFYKRKVAENTYRITIGQYKNHIAPHFRNAPLRRITTPQCQTLIDRLVDEGMSKTAESVFSTLNLIFKTAIKHSLLVHNPMDLVFHTKHAQKHGTALTKDEEKLLLDKMADTPFEVLFAVALYTGMRPNEYYTAQITEKFIVANNSKRKNGAVELKKIPITPMLRPYIEGVQELNFPSLDIMRRRFAKVMPKHKLYDLRTTFYTRCHECGIADVARMEFVGHSLGALGNAYTDLSDEFLLKEGEKFKY